METISGPYPIILYGRKRGCRLLFARRIAISYCAKTKDTRFAGAVSARLRLLYAALILEAMAH